MSTDILFSGVTYIISKLKQRLFINRNARYMASMLMLASIVWDTYSLLPARQCMAKQLIIIKMFAKATFSS